MKPTESSRTVYSDQHLLSAAMIWPAVHGRALSLKQPAEPTANTTRHAARRSTPPERAFPAPERTKPMTQWSRRTIRRLTKAWECTSADLQSTPLMTVEERVRWSRNALPNAAVEFPEVRKESVAG